MKHDDDLHAMTYGISFLRTNKDADEYVRKYCVKHKLTKEQAMEHLLVKGVLEMYEKKEQREADV